ncbi:hypothetical protein ACP70R_010245 [Stipagrostis hirtigluma subsp. patula]
MATYSRAPLSPPSSSDPAAGLTGPGVKGGSSVPAPEEEMKLPADLAPAADLTKDPSRPGRSLRFTPKVPMTKEEEEELIGLKLQHMSGTKKLLARTERRDQLRKRCEEVLFKRRCWAATFANHVVSLRADAAHVRHQLRVGWKKGEPLPEELLEARKRIHSVYVINEHIGWSMDLGLDAFLEDYRNFYEKIRREKVEAEPKTVCSDQNGAPASPVASN